MTLRPLRLWILAALLGGSSLLAQGENQAPPPVASVQTASGEDMIDGFKLSDADIDSVLSLLEMLTGKTIIRPSALPGVPYTLHIKKPLPRSEAIQALETVLSLNGIGVAPMGDKFLKVVALAQVRTEAPEIINGSTLELFPSGRIAAKLFQPDYLRIEDFTQQAQQLVSPGVGGGIVLFPKANAALITDTITNLQRMETLLKRLDMAAPSPKFYTLKFAKASELVQKIQGILQNPTLQAQLGATPTYTADDRTNQVILVADAQQHVFFDSLIERLDVKADPNTRTEVIYLKHAASKDVASLLTQIISGQTNAAQKMGSQAQIQRAETPAAANKPATAAAAGPIASTGTSSTTFSSIITVIADERTNAVVVNGTMDDIRLISELVDKVDIILAQVRIEVVIAEVSLSDNQSTGIGELGLKVEANKLVGISGSGPGFSLGNGVAKGFASIIDGDLSGIIGLSSDGKENGKSKASIISSPTITTTHNKEAEIFVGTSIPTISSYLNDGISSGSSISSGSGYRSTVSGQEVGIRLKILPLIGDDGTVQVAIEQEVNSEGEKIEIDNNPQYKINKRTSKSFITVKNREIIVLGGLQQIEDKKSSARLGPIPIIGDLLGPRSKNKARTDLLFFLRPIVLQGSEISTAEAIKQLEKYPQRTEVQEFLNPGSVPAKAEPPAPPKTRGKK